jgi:hypothetical protein
MIPEASRTTSRPCKSCVGRHRADHRFPRGTNRQCIRQTTIGVRTFIASPHSSAATASLVEERARRRKLAGGLSGTVCRPKRSVRRYPRGSACSRSSTARCQSCGSTKRGDLFRVAAQLFNFQWLARLDAAPVYRDVRKACTADCSYFGSSLNRHDALCR